MAALSAARAAAPVTAPVVISMPPRSLADAESLYTQLLECKCGPEALGAALVRLQAVYLRIRSNTDSTASGESTSTADQWVKAYRCTAMGCPGTLYEDTRAGDVVCGTCGLVCRQHTLYTGDAQRHFAEDDDGGRPGDTASLHQYGDALRVGETLYASRLPNLPGVNKHSIARMLASHTDGQRGTTLVCRQRDIRWAVEQVTRIGVCTEVRALAIRLFEHQRMAHEHMVRVTELTAAVVLSQRINLMPDAFSWVGQEAELELASAYNRVSDKQAAAEKRTAAALAAGASASVAPPAGGDNHTKRRLHVDVPPTADASGPAAEPVARDGDAEGAAPPGAKKRRCESGKPVRGVGLYGSPRPYGSPLFLP